MDAGDVLISSRQLKVALAEDPVVPVTVNCSTRKAGAVLGGGGTLAKGQSQHVAWLRLVPLWIILFCSHVFQDMVINFFGGFMDELGPGSTFF